MKYYSNVCIPEDYILSYKIKNDNIIIKLANKIKNIIPYTKENEKSILLQMERQAKQAKVTRMSIIDQILAISQPLLLPVAIMNLICYGTWFFWIILLMMAADAIIYPIRYRKYKSKIKELKKIYYFLDNKNELNNYIEKVNNNEKTLTGVRKKTINLIESQQQKQNPPLNINDIESYSLKDLKKIKENLFLYYSYYYDIEHKNKILEDIKQKNKVLENIEQKNKVLEKQKNKRY